MLRHISRIPPAHPAAAATTLRPRHGQRWASTWPSWWSPAALAAGAGGFALEAGELTSRDQEQLCLKWKKRLGGNGGGPPLFPPQRPGAPSGGGGPFLWRPSPPWPCPPTRRDYNFQKPLRRDFGTPPANTIYVSGTRVPQRGQEQEQRPDPARLRHPVSYFPNSGVPDAQPRGGGPPERLASTHKATVGCGHRAPRVGGSFPPATGLSRVNTIHRHRARHRVHRADAELLLQDGSWVH